MDMIPFGELQLMSPPSADTSKTVLDKGDIALAGKGGASGLPVNETTNGDVYYDAGVGSIAAYDGR